MDTTASPTTPTTVPTSDNQEEAMARHEDSGRTTAGKGSSEYRSLIRLGAGAGGVAAGLAVVGALAVAVATAVFAVQMAVDGVALKHAVDAWKGATSSAAQESAFLVADSVRSIEKGLSAVFHFSNGAALLTLGGAVATARRRPWRGWVGGAVGGFGFIVASWVTAHTGFSSQAGTILLPTGVLALIFVVAVNSPKETA